MRTGFDIDIIRLNIARTKRVLPIALAKITENHFTESFKVGRLDEHKWKEVQRRIPGTSAYKYPRKKGLSRRTSPILVRTGNLRRKTSRSIASATWAKVQLINDLPYAKAQNEGTDTIDARPFMIHTNKLGGLQKAEIDKQMKKIWV